MKKHIFLYLFVFAALIALYLAVSGSRMRKSLVKKNKALTTKVDKFQDSITQLSNKLWESQYFVLDNNEDALVYFDHLNLEDPAAYIADKLIETNIQEGDNPLVPYAGMEGDFKINKIKIVNHKWLLADFSDGKFWGDLIIKYELKDDLSIDFTMADHLLYARN